MKLLQTGLSFPPIVSLIPILHVEVKINLHWTFRFFGRILSAVWYM